jgi:hypothetical protein
MGIFRGPNIVRDGLVLQLDAANTKSYPAAGSTWYDLSGNGNDHTITNSPTFSNGAFTINETQSFTRSSMPTNNTNCTVLLFYKTTDTQELWVRGNSGSFYVAASYSNGNYYNDNVGSPTYYVDTLTTTNPNTPINYRNGDYHMWEAKNVNFSAWNQLNWFGYGSSWNMNGTVAYIALYDRALTATESLQNYNALKSRFGI